MRPRQSVWAAALLLLLGGPNVTQGDIIVFTSEADFLAAAGDVSTETFDAFPTFPPRPILGTGQVTISGVTYTADPTTDWVASATFGSVSPPNALAGRNAIDTRTMTFGTDEPTNAVGFFLLPATVSQHRYQVVVTAADGEQYTEVFGLAAPIPRYRGFVAIQGISSVEVTPLPDSGGGFLNYGFDNVTALSEKAAL